MAKKRAKPMVKVKEERTGRPVRLDLSPADYDRLGRCATARGLNKSSYARMAVLALIKEDESDDGPKR
jgi:hypothetical protein